MAKKGRKSKKRWHVEIEYGNTGEHLNIDELFELHDIIESGPDWNLISWIKITLNERDR